MLQKMFVCLVALFISISTTFAEQGDEIEKMIRDYPISYLQYTAV